MCTNFDWFRRFWQEIERERERKLEIGEEQNVGFHNK